jgi:hypothetical protein
LGGIALIERSQRRAKRREGASARAWLVEHPNQARAILPS